jgi:hypothetical protein
MIPDNGNRAYNYYLEGDKVNGKRKRRHFRDVRTRLRPVSEGTVRRAGEANRSSGNIQNPMTGEDRELGELCPLSPTPSPDGNIGSVVVWVLDAPSSRSCLNRWTETRNGGRRTGVVQRVFYRERKL